MQEDGHAYDCYVVTRSDSVRHTETAVTIPNSTLNCSVIVYDPTAALDKACHQGLAKTVHGYADVQLDEVYLSPFIYEVTDVTLAWRSWRLRGCQKPSMVKSAKAGVHS